MKRMHFYLPEQLIQEGMEFSKSTSTAFSEIIRLALIDYLNSVTDQIHSWPKVGSMVLHQDFGLGIVTDSGTDNNGDPCVWVQFSGLPDSEPINAANAKAWLKFFG